METQNSQRHNDHLPVLVPDMDVIENEEGYIVQADVPGVTIETLETRLENRELTLVAWTAGEFAGSHLKREFVPVRYQHAFVVPRDVDTSRIDVSLAKGVMTIALPRAEEARMRKIPVRTG